MTTRRPSPPGKNAGRTSGAGAIGSEAAALLAGLGARVAVTHRPGHAKAKAAERLIAVLPGEGHATFPADVADTATLTALRDAVAERYGRLDVLVNAAGFTNAVPHADLDALTDEMIDQIFAVNWRGAFA